MNKQVLEHSFSEGIRTIADGLSKKASKMEAIKALLKSKKVYVPAALAASAGVGGGVASALMPKAKTPAPPTRMQSLKHALGVG